VRRPLPTLGHANVKITAVRTHLVNIPLVTGYRWAPGIYFGATKGLIEVETDLGITGWGEVATALQRCKLRFEREGPQPQLGEPGAAYHRRFRRQ
jgi:hypothetical protein